MRDEEDTERRTALWLGDWRDASGRVLRVTRAGGALAASFFGADGAPLRRRALGREDAPAAELPAVFEGEELVVELGEPGLGPTLRLSQERGEEVASSLVPEVRMGLYDDYEDELGAPFVFPLSPYRRV